MEQISLGREVSAPLDRIWEIVSDVDNDPKYWPGLDSVSNIRKSGNTVEREVTVGFRNSKGRQTVTLEPKSSVVTRLTEGPMIGIKTVALSQAGDNKTKIEVSWKIERLNVPFIAVSFLEKQIRKSTKDALDKIAEAVEQP